jgi:hypothetical protein
MINLIFKRNSIKNNHFLKKEVDKNIILCYNKYIRMRKGSIKMGHLIEYFEYPKTGDTKKDKEMIKEDVREWARYESDGGCYHGNLTFKPDTVFDDYKEAREWLEMFEGNYRDYAVLYMRYDEDVINQKIKKLKEKIEILTEQRKAYKQKNLLSKRKSKTVTCPKCKSSLSIEYLTRCDEESHYCPLCLEDLLSKTVIERKNKFSKDIKEIKEKIENEIKKEAKKQKKFNLQWIVKVEEHC